MNTRIRPAFVLAVLILATGCSELPGTQPSIEPTEPVLDQAAAPSESEPPVASTVCGAYMDQLAELRAESAARSEEPTLLAQVSALTETVADICS